MQAVTLLIKDALTRHRTALPSLRRAFSHTSDRRRAFSHIKLGNNVSEDQIRLHFRVWCKRGKWGEEHDKMYGPAEESEQIFKAFKTVYEGLVESNVDPSISDVYCLADHLLRPVGPLDGTE